MSETEALTVAIVALQLEIRRLMPIAQYGDEARKIAATIERNRQAIKVLEQMLQKVKVA